VSKPSRHPTEKGLREKNGKWEYRFKLNGNPYSQVTDLEAVAANINSAQALRTAHIEQIKSGKMVMRRVNVPLDQAVSHFMRWYRSEHPRGGKCKWASSLMASFQFYFDQTRRPLSVMGPAELEEFKMWRRENSIHDNSLRKQLLLLNQFFRHARKHGWMKTDPFAKGQDGEVRIPTEQDSTAMHVLSPMEEARYFAEARTVDMDLADVAAIMKEQGPRPDEIMSLQQSHVDLFRRHFTIWDNSAEGKTKNAHRKLKMTDETFRIFARRLTEPGLWIFPSSKNDDHRTTLQKSHERVVRGKKNRGGDYEGGCGVACRLYDMRHTFATRFALAGGSLPVLAKILGHADLGMLNKYVHPSQEDMDRAMEWYAGVRTGAAKLEDMLVESEGQESWPRPLSGPPTGLGVARNGPLGPKSEKKKAG
jgi:integrase